MWADHQEPGAGQVMHAESGTPCMVQADREEFAIVIVLGRRKRAAVEQLRYPL